VIQKPVYAQYVNRTPSPFLGRVGEGCLLLSSFFTQTIGQYVVSHSDYGTTKQQ
jgi:hypothetical protein